MLVLTACSSEEAGSPQAGSTSSPRATAAEDTEPTGSQPADRPGEATTGPCGYRPTPDEPPSRPVSLPEDPDPTPAGPDTLTLRTGAGDIALTLDGEQAPCTVQSFVHLAASGFYDGTSCHRLVASDGFRILQCGDPTGTSTGGPGYTIPDEPPAGLVDAPVGRGAKVYPRGTVAMAKTAAPNSGGSQFFLVFGDTYLPPDYTIFGTIDEAGTQALETVGEGGVQGGESDGPPNVTVTITQAVTG